PFQEDLWHKDAPASRRPGKVRLPGVCFAVPPCLLSAVDFPVSAEGFPVFAWKPPPAVAAFPSVKAVPSSAGLYRPTLFSAAQVQQKAVPAGPIPFEPCGRPPGDVGVAAALPTGFLGRSAAPF